LDNQLQQENKLNQGATATIGLITLEGAEKVIYIANVGDTRAVLFGYA